MFIANLPAVFPASLKSPCKILFDTVNSERKLSTALPVPFLIDGGRALYPFAIGLKIALSKP